MGHFWKKGDRKSEGSFIKRIKTLRKLWNSIPLERTKSFIFGSIFDLTPPIRWPKDASGKFWKMSEHPRLKVLGSEAIQTLIETLI